MKLIDFKVVIICPAHDEKYIKRLENTKKLLSTLGFRNIEHFKSGTKSYPNCLSLATIEVLKQHLDDNPVLIVEDDINITEWANINDEFVYPTNTDAFYLGFSMDGGSTTLNSHDGPSKIKCVSKKNVKIENMLTTHAIIYVTARYKQACINQLEYAILNNMYNDVAISRIQEKYNIYGFYYPWFYQTEPEWTKSRTNFRYQIKNVNPVVVTAYYPTNTKKHTLNEYKQWYNNFFKCVTADVICFCPPNMLQEFQSISKENHIIIPREFHSFEMMSPAYMKIWEHFYQSDIENTHHCPELYAIWAAKQEFVREAINILDSDIYIWCDIGCFRTINDGHFLFTKKYIIENKITCLYLDSYNTIGGGILAGDKNSWNIFSKLYLDELNKNPNGKDQVIYTRILNSDNANIIKKTNFNLDEWFYLRYIFNYDV